jgi:hypothetical protein|tara:strand:+ start:245 stop:436 length:192 start_codon:yes stop_codon:yes gene_type:complete
MDKSGVGWLPDDLTNEGNELVSMVSVGLDYNIDKARAFAVALLVDVNDHSAASQVNDVLLGAE